MATIGLMDTNNKNYYFIRLHCILMHYVGEPGAS